MLILFVTRHSVIIFELSKAIPTYVSGTTACINVYQFQIVVCYVHTLEHLMYNAP